MAARISLCVIARDEEAMLGDCLASAKAAADEIIVVDTGSRDGTKAIAEAAGATIVDFVWCDDFAKARNVSIDAATGDWILILDADERLAADAPAAIRSTLAQHGDTFDCGLLHLHDAARLDAPHDEVLSGRARIGEPMFVARLLRKDHGLAYEGAIHESIRSWLVKSGNRQRDVGAHIVHLGAVPSHRVQRDKSSRNIALLEKRLAEEPDDFTIHGYMAHELIGAGREEEAWACIAQGWTLLETADPTTLRSALRLAAARALMQFQRGDADGVLDTVGVIEAYEGPGADMSFFRARAHETKALAAATPQDRRQALALAEKGYRQCLGRRGEVSAQRYVRGATSWAAATRLATVKLLQGAPGEALPLFEGAFADNPALEEAKLGAAEALIVQGEAAAALERLEPLLGDGPDAWLLVADAADALGDADTFAQALKQARERAGRGYAAPHRNQRHGALHAELLAYHGEPNGRGKGTIGRACAIMADSALSDVAPVDPYERPALRAFCRNMILRGHVGLVEKLLQDEAEASTPGLRTTVEAAVADLGMSLEEKPS